MHRVLLKSLGLWLLSLILDYPFFAQELIQGGSYRLQLEDGSILEEAIFLEKKTAKDGKTKYLFRTQAGTEMFLERFSLLPLESKPKEEKDNGKSNLFYEISGGGVYPLNQKELNFGMGFRGGITVHFRPFPQIPWLYFSLAGGYFYLTGNRAYLFGPEVNLGMGYMVPLLEKFTFFSQIEPGIGFYKLKNQIINQNFTQNTAILLWKNGIYYRILKEIRLVLRLEQNFIYDEKRPLWLMGGSLGVVLGGLP